MLYTGFTSRFGVGNPIGRQSGVWRVWADPGKSDVYVAIRTIAGVFKISLHCSGDCNVSLTTQATESNPTAVQSLGGTRHIDQWQRPTHTGSLLSIPLRLAFLESELRFRVHSRSLDSRIMWLPAPAPGFTLDVLCNFSGQSYAAGDFPWRADGGTLRASAVLQNGESFWLVSKPYKTPAGFALTIERQRERAKQPAPIELAKAGTFSVPADRLLIGETGPGNVRILFDAALNACD